MKLVIGNKNYSSWSLRPWLAMKMAGVAFEELRIVLDRPDTKGNIRAVSPSGKVPCLLDGDLTIWDSLAICEYVNETYAAGRLWPAERGARARARAVSAEMHSGFTALRLHMPMDIRSRHAERGAQAQARAEVAADIERICAIWSEALQGSGGPWLFGEFSIADAMYAPVVTRFATYGAPLPAPLAAYSAQVFAAAPMQQWVAAARAETETIDY
ncbi:MAG: glutathione S-transferase family protein [Burkholderiales bacterium]|jgi:glutathione S-transferase|nr:glutathione S-transferase family protein [Burkholderiales bacterium]